MPSSDFKLGLAVGRGSMMSLLNALRSSLGDWAKILPYLDQFTSKNELELVAAINYLMNREITLTPTLKASIAVDFVNSSRSLLLSDLELFSMPSGGESGGKEEERKEGEEE